MISIFVKFESRFSAKLYDGPNELSMLWPKCVIIKARIFFGSSLFRLEFKVLSNFSCRTS